MTTDTRTAPSALSPAAGAPSPLRPRRRPRRRGWLLCALGLVLALAAVFPLAWMVLGSFKTAQEVNSPQLLPETFTLENFRYVFSQVPFARYLLNSFVVSAAVTVVALWFHSMAAYALARLQFPGRERIFLAIFATMLVSAPVTIIPTFIIVRTLGMVDSYAGLIVPAIFNAFGIFLLRQFYVSLTSSRRRRSWTARATGRSTGRSCCRCPGRSSPRSQCSSSSPTGTPSCGR